MSFYQSYDNLGDLEVVEAPQFLSTSFVLLDQEQDSLEDTIIIPDNYFSLMSPYNEKEKLNKDSLHSIQDTTTTLEVKKNEFEPCNHGIDKYSPNLFSHITNYQGILLLFNMFIPRY